MKRRVKISWIDDGQEKGFWTYLNKLTVGDELLCPLDDHVVTIEFGKILNVSYHENITLAQTAMGVFEIKDPWYTPTPKSHAPGLAVHQMLTTLNGLTDRRQAMIERIVTKRRRQKFQLIHGGKQ